MQLTPGFAKIVFWLCLATVAVAQVGLLISTVRALKDRAAQPVTEGDPTLRIRRAPEVVWAIIPAIALAFLFAGTWQALNRVSDAGEIRQPNPPATLTGAPTLLAERVAAPVTRVQRVPHRIAPRPTQMLDESDYAVLEQQEQMQR